MNITNSETNKKLKFQYTSNCAKCGKPFTQEITKYKLDKGDYRKYCCRSCSNSRTRDVMVKEKIRKSVEMFYKKAGRCRKSDVPSERINCPLKFRHKSKTIKKQNCIYCKKEIFAKRDPNTSYCYDCSERLNLKPIRLYHENGRRLISDKTKCALRTAQLKLIKTGEHVGWSSRSLESYPEKFWKKVLDEQGISYSFNHPIAKSSIGLSDSGNYFLDFLIYNKIDLEIDGKQHEYPDRKVSDDIRDSALRANGYVVYRIKWNEINTDRGKEEMKKKIDDFVHFIQDYAQ